MGDEKVLHRLPTARGRPSDLAVRQLAALTADSPGVLGELGLTVLQAWQRVSEAQGRGRGEVVKRLGDGLMGAFADAPSAAEAALEAGERAAEIELAGYTPHLRSGIHLGRPRKIGGDYFGVDVNIAARLAEAAEPGEVLVSDRTLKALDPHAIVATRRSFKAKGAPADLAAHAVRRQV